VGRGASAAGSVSVTGALGRSMTLALGAALQSDMTERESSVSAAGLRFLRFYFFCFFLVFLVFVRIV
jgi:hypothetical protein